MSSSPPDSDELTAQLRQLRDWIYGNWKTCVVYAFAELRLADLLAPASATVPALAQATATDADALGRYLRCAAGLGLVQWRPQTEDYTLTPLGLLLTSDHPQSQRAAAQLNGADYRYHPWGRLVEVLRQGNNRGLAPTAESGTLAYLAERPADLAVFHRAMTGLSVGDNEALAHAFDFGRFAHVMDVGGGEGTLLTAILDACPGLTGTLFDLPATLDALGPVTPELAARLHRQAGDFFQAVPPGADLYLLKNVVHNWPAAQALQLLQMVRTAMVATPAGRSDRRLLIVEYLVTEGPSLAAWLDLNFLVLVDGRERTLEEYRTLGQAAGLELLQAHPTPIGRHMLEFAAAPD